MYNFIIPYTIHINGESPEEGVAGVVSRLFDYRSNAIKTTAVNYYHEKYNTTKTVSVTLEGNLVPYPDDVYALLRPGFTIEVVEKGFSHPY